MAKLMGRRVFSGQRDDDDPRSRGQLRAQEQRDWLGEAFAEYAEESLALAEEAFPLAAEVWSL
jgi:hypothetical protein